ncbi:GGDEF domain-containing protein [Jatrophihabitans sp. DSM 45814]
MALITAVFAAMSYHYSRQSWINVAILLVLSIGFQEVSGKVEKFRNRIGSTRHVDMTSVWIFAAVIVLPLSLTLLLLIALRAHLWVKVNRPASNAPYRSFFTAATIWISCIFAHEVLAAFPDGKPLPSGFLAIASVVTAICAFTFANSALVFSAVWLASRPDSSPPFRTIWQDSFLEISTLCLAGLAGLALIYEPWLIVLVVPAMAILQRSVLVKELQEAATTDSKTGLLNAQAWHRVATVELERSMRADVPAALLIVDMDNFKLINDTHGHLAGDAVLKAVADVLTDELRAYDSVGRFGGEEFVALLPRVDALNALAISDRILQRVRDLHVATRDENGLGIRDMSASIGIAVCPQQGSDVEDLLHIADAALYTAKREGRDRVEYSYIG